MKKMILRILMITGIVLVSIIIICAIGLSVFIIRTWPKYSGSIKINGLNEKVVIKRDKWAIPHIYAENNEDLLFAQGYVHAQDRLWQMESFRRISKGTLSEVFGSATIWADKEARTLGIKNIAELSIPLLDPEVRELINYYCDGINYYIDTHQNCLPVEFTIFNFKPRHWTPVDVIAWGNLSSFSTAQNWRYEILRAEFAKKLGEDNADKLLPVMDKKGHPLIIPEETTNTFEQISFKYGNGFDEILPGITSIGWASGAWAVNGDHTSTGKAILTSDAHLNTRLPSIWYENGLHGGDFDVVGFCFPGFPFVLIGHNNDIAWAFTNMNPDVQDLYIEKLDNYDNPSKYLFQDEWLDLKTRKEVINVKGQDPIILEVKLSHHGPLITELVTIVKDFENYYKNHMTQKKTGLTKWTGERSLSLNWPIREGGKSLNSIYKMNIAENWDEFKESLREWDGLSQNFVYADTKGNIGYQGAGKIPIREENHLGIVPVPGWTGEYEWQGFIPYDELPNIYNPKQGFIVAANNKIVEDYKYRLTYDYFHPGYRSRRINTLLKEKINKDEKLTIDDMHRIMGDTYTEWAGPIAECFTKIIPDNEIEKEALDRIKNWDLYFDTDSLGAGMFLACYEHLRVNIFYDEFEKNELAGPFIPMKQRLALSGFLERNEDTWFDNVNTPEIETRNDTFHKSLKEAIAWLTKEYGEDSSKWTLGTIQTASLLDITLGTAPVIRKIYTTKPLPYPGSSVSVCFAWSVTYPPDRLNIQFAATQRQIIDLSDWDSMLSVNCSGQCGHVFHKNRVDQTPLWAYHDFRTMYFSRSAVEKNAVKTLILKGVNK